MIILRVLCPEYLIEISTCLILHSFSRLSLLLLGVRWYFPSSLFYFVCYTLRRCVSGGT
jgi:hypothetical protein